jgi:hypothetical protein
LCYNKEAKRLKPESLDVGACGFFLFPEVEISWTGKIFDDVVRVEQSLTL